MINIPSDEDFARADRMMEERYRNIDNVESAVMHSFRSACPIFKCCVLVQEDVDFRVYVFFRRDKDIEECRQGGIIQDIEDFVYDELERQGRGRRRDITVAFEFDSDENVARPPYNGDYYLRLL